MKKLTKKECITQKMWEYIEDQECINILNNETICPKCKYPPNSFHIFCSKCGTKLITQPKDSDINLINLLHKAFQIGKHTEKQWEKKNAKK